MEDTRMDKKRIKKRRNRGYADKVKARRQLARKHGLPENYTYPQIWERLELMGVKVNE